MSRRRSMEKWTTAALDAVEPRRLTREALETHEGGPSTLIAIGKAAAAMCWGAHDALGGVRGICVTVEPTPVPAGVDLLVGDHPTPGRQSFEAGERVLEFARELEGDCIALVSGGGSSLCEYPRPGVDKELLIEVNRALVESGAGIDRTNLVRRHLSAIKGGGVALALEGIVETYVLSDVAGFPPELVASGPTIPTPSDPAQVEEILEMLGLALSSQARSALELDYGSFRAGTVHVLADGRTAAAAIASAATSRGIEARVAPGWIRGDLVGELDSFVDNARSGLTVAAGEPSLSVEGSGSGGRNSHAALVAAGLISGTDDLFMAFATDGTDGNSNAAGAIVDGTTLNRGGSPTKALEDFDSASYLRNVGDLIVTGPTGTNVSDLWVLWRE